MKDSSAVRLYLRAAWIAATRVGRAYRPSAPATLATPAGSQLIEAQPATQTAQPEASDATIQAARSATRPVTSSSAWCAHQNLRAEAEHR